MIQPLIVKLGDELVERVRANHEARIAELAGLPIVGATVIRDVSLADAVDTPVVHRLGRRPIFVSPSAPRGATTSGRIEEIRTLGSSHDPAQRVVLRATGWGATITVDVLLL